MSEQFLCIEVYNPTSVKGLMNVYISLDDDPKNVENGFRRLREDGCKTTGVITRMERVNGVMRRVEAFRGQRLFEQGFRTLSAFLRA